MNGAKRAGYRTALPAANIYTVPCPVIHALRLIGGKWKLPILWHLFDAETVRYNELKRRVVGVTNIMLTQCLRELEADGLVRRIDYGEVPPRVEYALSDLDESMQPIMKSMGNRSTEYKNGKLPQQPFPLPKSKKEQCACGALLFFVL